MTREEIDAAHLRCEPVILEGSAEVWKLYPKIFKSGSRGWHAQGKVKIDDVDIQVNLMFTVIGSKPGYVKKVVTYTPGSQSRFEFGEQDVTMPGNGLGASEPSAGSSNGSRGKKVPPTRS